MVIDVDIKEKIKRRWNESARTFDQRPGHGIHSNREKMLWQSLLMDLVGDNQQEMLDVGTGTGFIALMLSEMGHKVTGIDIADDMLKQAKDKAGKKNLNIKFQWADADAVPFSDDTFDVVINRHVLWTMPEPEKAIKEWIRVLKPGGKLVIIDGCLDHNSIGKVLWKKVSNMVIWLAEGRKSRDKSQGFRDFEDNLPMRKVRRPEADMAMLKKLGLKVRLIEFKDPRSYGFLNNIKYGYYSMFVSVAIKEHKGSNWEAADY